MSLNLYETLPAEKALIKKRQELEHAIQSLTEHFASVISIEHDETNGLHTIKVNIAADIGPISESGTDLDAVCQGLKERLDPLLESRALAERRREAVRAWAKESNLEFVLTVELPPGTPADAKMPYYAAELVVGDYNSRSGFKYNDREKIMDRMLLDIYDILSMLCIIDTVC